MSVDRYKTICTQKPVSSKGEGTEIYFKYFIFAGNRYDRIDSTYQVHSLYLYGIIGNIAINEKCKKIDKYSKGKNIESSNNSVIHALGPKLYKNE